jgi:phosphate:Na+ symporter
MSESTDWLVLIMGLFGGLSIFLLGMDRTVSGVKGLAGNRLRTIMSRLTGNRWAGVATGAGITAVIQSSSVTTVIVVGLISAGVMSLAQSVGVIFGANIGTTITAQIVAFKVTKYALGVVAIGFGIEFFSKTEKVERIGRTVMGLGLVFFGMAVMATAMKPLQDNEAFLDAMASISNPWIGILLGAVFTALLQSSSATIAIVIAMATAGLVTLDLAIALVLGANIGTSITAQLAALGKPRAAVRAAVVHTTFNVLGVVIWVPFIGFLAWAAMKLSPPDDIARQVAWSTTIFNVANVLIFIWFAAWFARFAEFLVRDRPLEEAAMIQARYLNVDLLNTPSLALDRARLEIARMGSRVRDMLEAAIPAVIRGSLEELDAVEALDDEVDALYEHVITYLAEISKRELTNEQTAELLGLMEATNDIEAVGDAVETNLVSDGRRRLEFGVVVSDSTAVLIEDLGAQVLEGVDIAVAAVGQSNPEAAQRAIKMKAKITERTVEAQTHQVERLGVDEPLRLEAYKVESDIIEDLKRVYYYAKRAARVGVPRDSTPEDAAPPADEAFEAP